MNLGFTEKEIRARRAHFDEDYEGAEEIDILKDQLFVQKLSLEKLEAIRSNTSKIVWWTIALPLITWLIWVGLNALTR